ncbi:MAG TPA: nucleotide disphospho-sugar-binding domain-containing protein [Pseudonocardiaceae bacterium]|jgi:UDP:flavonoid glycosyltransferase YjiC (YdhE family)|nr:nucleotide disphospho-sugar-binding domain-containing protein [Pseudonocardiaceae bacterium]
MRFLLVVPPLTGHVTPLRVVATELARRGHRVAWCGPQPATSQLVGAASIFPAGASDPFAVERRPAGLRGFAALKYLWENYLIPLADAMLPGVCTAIERFGPDVVVADQQALAGALAAATTGVRWATSATTPAGLAEPAAGMPRITAWIRRLVDELCTRNGSAPRDLRFSPDLVIAFTIPELAGAPMRHCHYAGAPRARASATDFPWAALDGRPLVVVTLGTSNAPAGRRFLAMSVHALSTMDHVQGVVIDPTGELASRDVLLRPAAPLPDLLRRAAVTVCHGGHNTVCESLDAGVPLVVAPIRDDQTALAARVVDNGVGVRLRFDRATAADLRHAVTSVLTDPGYRGQAAHLQHSLRVAGGAGTAADLLESLSAKGTTCNPTWTERCRGSNV